MTITRITLVLALALSAFTAGQAKDKKDWQSGTLLDSETTSRYAGQSGGATANCPNCVSSPINIVTQTVIIAADDYTYTAQSGGCGKARTFVGVCLVFKPAALTVNAPIKFAVDLKKQRLYLIDDMGEEVELGIIKRVKK